MPDIRTKCPHCNSPMTRIRTDPIDELTTEVYMLCKERTCGALLGMHQQIFTTYVDSENPRPEIEEKIGKRRS